MTWLSELGNRVGIGIGIGFKRSSHLFDTKNHQTRFRQKEGPTLGILAFETAKTMSRLISLYKSLSDEEIIKLRKGVMASEGVEYLNSNDEAYLLKLACAERLEDLERAVVVVSRLGKKCSDAAGLNQFENVYADLKFGFIDLGRLDSSASSREIEKNMDKMERYISATSHLFSGLETLTELESSEKKIKQLKKKKKKKTHKMTTTAAAAAALQKANPELLQQRLSWQNQQVRHLREVSIWNQSFDKIVGLMARTICIVYARICLVFGPYNSLLPTVSTRHVRFFSQPILRLESNNNNNAPSSPEFPSNDHHHHPIISKSGPILKPPSKDSKQGLLLFWSRETKPSATTTTEKICFRTFFKELGGIGGGGGIITGSSSSSSSSSSRLVHQASPSTVGGSGLALRYANVIILMERYLNSPASINDYGRKDLYQMLPENLKMSVKIKLKNLLKKENDSGWWDDDTLADGLKDGLKVILGWLAPMAHDTVRWQSEKNFEKMNFDVKPPTVLLLQTLFFADKEKAEAAITEVLVGLSFICRYEMIRSRGH